MNGANLPASPAVKGPSSKTEMKASVLDSMKRLHAAKEAQDYHQQKKKAAQQQPKYQGRVESDVGIKQFVDSSEGFTGITKHRWGDFIVHEIDLAGEVVTLTDMSVPMKAEQVQEEVQRPDWFPEDIWEKIVQLNDTKKCADAVNVPAGPLSKEQRTQYHTTIKSCFPKLVTNTSEIDGEKVIAVKKANAAPDKRNTFWKHKPWPKDRPKFLHFSLFKENLDTFVALSNLSMDLKLKSNKFAFAGTKDARAKTTQMISVKQVTAEKVHEAARKFPRMAVGNFTYKDSELKLGDLRGNQFDLVLRHVQGSEEVMARRIASFESAGFVNYYGLQRFGTTSVGTHQVGRAILRREWRIVVDLLLSGQEEGTGSMAEAQRAWRADRDPRRALSCLSGKQQRTSIEGRVLYTLSTVRATAYQEAVDRLPAGTRQLYVHAYQSWLWNQVVSRRLAEHGLKLRPGDLVLADGQRGSAADTDLTSDDPSAAGSDLAEQAAEPSEAQAESAESDAAAKDGAPSGRSAFLPRLPEVRVLTEADLDSYSIYDLVLPLPGWAVKYPENEMAQWYTELLAADDVKFSRELSDSMPQYSMAGAYRAVMARPGAVTWRLLHYSDTNADLIPSDLDRLRGLPPPADEPGAPFRALVLQFTLTSSSYATMALREITGTDSGLAAQMELNAAYSAEMRRVRDQCIREAATGAPKGAANTAGKDGKTAAAVKSAEKDGKPASGEPAATNTAKDGEADQAKSACEEEKMATGGQKEGGDGEPEKATQQGQGQKRQMEDGEPKEGKRPKTD